MCKRCEELLAENARLRDMLEMRSRADLIGRMRTYLGLTDQQARILLRLYQDRGGLVTYGALHSVMPPRYYSTRHGRERHTDYLRVQLHKARQQIGQGMIETVRGYGVRLTPDGCLLVAAALVGDKFRDAA